MTITRLFSAVAAVALMSGAAIAQTAPPVQPAAATAPVVAKGDLIETATASGQFTTLLKALEATNLTSVIKTNPNLTVFAPTDAAFAALPAGALDKLMLPENAATLQKVLTYHVINTRVDSSKIIGAKGEVKTVEGSAVTLDGSGSAPMVDGANITQADIMATNGVLHVVDKVLMPKDLPGAQASAATDAATSMDVAANVQATPPMSAPADDTATMTVAPATTPSATPPSATMAGVDTAGAIPTSSQSPEAQAMLKAGDPNVVSNPPVADTAENRAKYGKPMSNAGKRSAAKGN